MTLRISARMLAGGTAFSAVAARWKRRSNAFSKSAADFARVTIEMPALLCAMKIGPTGDSSRQ